MFCCAREAESKQDCGRAERYFYVMHFGEGKGLIVYGDTILPFLDHFNKESRLYQVMTEKQGEVRTNM